MNRTGNFIIPSDLIAPPIDDFDTALSVKAIDIALREGAMHDCSMPGRLDAGTARRLDKSIPNAIASLIVQHAEIGVQTDRCYLGALWI